MTKAVRLVLATCAPIVAGAALVACGGVPGNAVATVDGKPIDKATFNHWLNIAAKSSGQPNAVVPDPPTFARCVAQKRKTTPKPGKGQPKVTDTQLKKQCQQEYTQLRDQVIQLLISFQWIQGEAKEQGVTVSNAEVQKSLQQQKQQAFPKEADFQRFMKTSGYTMQDIIQRIKLDLLSTKIRDKVVKGKGTVTPAQIQSYYAKNKAQFGTPEKRDLRIVLTKTRARAEQALKALKSGQSWKVVAKKYSIDATSKSQGGKLPSQAKGTLGTQLDAAVFSAPKGKLEGPVKTQFGFYDFVVEKITPAVHQSLQQATPTIRQTLQSQNQQKALDAFVKDFRARWRDKTECSNGYKTTDCKNGPKPTPTPSAGAGGTAPGAPGSGSGGGG